MTKQEKKEYDRSRYICRPRVPKTQEQIARKLEYDRQRSASPEFKLEKKRYNAEYCARPEVFSRRKSRRQDPAVKARDNESAKKRRQDAPEKYNAGVRRLRATRRDRLNLLKRGPCGDCGGKFPPECMDWGHLPGKIKCFGIACTSFKRSFEAVLEEIAKCELVCANCHRTRTFNRVQRGPKQQKGAA